MHHLGKILVRAQLSQFTIGAIFVLVTVGPVFGASLNIPQGDVVFGGLADPATTKQETPVCFDNATGTLGPCTDAVAGLPEALRVEMCNLYLQVSTLQFLPPPGFCDFELVQNDGWQDGATAVFQGGFVTGESAAASLGPLAAPSKLHAVYFFFGPTDPSLFDITLTIYEDDGASAEPGAVIYSGDFVLIGATNQMQVIDLRSENIQLAAAHFRVALTFYHDGPPSVARDNDGDIQLGRNWIDESTVGWVDAATFLLPGDWVIRALVEP